MVLKIQHFVIFSTILLSTSCKHGSIGLSKVSGKEVLIDATLKKSDSIETFVSPYRQRVDEILDSTLAYSPYVISKTDGALNSSAGNLMADIVFSEANPIFKARTGKEIDFVLLNHGGIRAMISKGDISSRTAYEVMPFENSIVVAELSGASVLEMASFLRDSGRAHPISGLQIILDRKNQIETLKIKGQPIDPSKTYYVATSNYLISGGDQMGFFKDATKVVDTDYLIRNAMIDYFKKVDTIAPTVDDRFIKLQ